MPPIVSPVISSKIARNAIIEIAIYSNLFIFLLSCHNSFEKFGAEP
jgi:hypothetical protein